MRGAGVGCEYHGAKSRHQSGQVALPASDSHRACSPCRGFIVHSPSFFFVFDPDQDELESMFRAIQFHDDPINDCGSGSDTQRGLAEPETRWCIGRLHACRLPSAHEAQRL